MAINTIRDWITRVGIKGELAEQVFYIVLAVIVLLVCAAANYITKRFVLRLVEKRIKGNKNSWDDVLVESGVLRRRSHIVPAAIIRMFSDLLYTGLSKATRHIPYTGFVL